MEDLSHRSCFVATIFYTDSIQIFRLSAWTPYLSQKKKTNSSWRDQCRNSYPRRWPVVTATINVPCSSYGCETATTYLPTGIISERLAELVSKQMRAFSSSQGECKTIKFAPGTIATITLATGQSITLTAPTAFGASRVQFSFKARIWLAISLSSDKSKSERFWEDGHGRGRREPNSLSTEIHRNRDSECLRIAAHVWFMNQH